jgi:hypothetical protein
LLIFYKNPKQNRHERLIEILYKSCPYEKKLYTTDKFAANARLNQRASALVFAGMIRGEGLIYKWCKQSSKRFFYLDHAYLNRGYNISDPDNEWFRITDSDFLWNKMEHRTSERWNQYFAEKYPLQPWRLKGKNILVLPPSQATQFIFPKSKLWLNHITRIIEKYTDKKIIIREKPTQQIIGVNNQIIKPLKYDHAKTMEEELADAYAIVTYNSGVTVQATIEGIPVICDQNNAAAPITNRIEEIASPLFQPREQWLYQLVHHQYRTREMIDGTVWEWLIPNGKI